MHPLNGCERVRSKDRKPFDLVRLPVKLAPALTNLQATRQKSWHPLVGRRGSGSARTAPGRASLLSRLSTGSGKSSGSFASLRRKHVRCKCVRSFSMRFSCSLVQVGSQWPRIHLRSARISCSDRLEVYDEPLSSTRAIFFPVLRARSPGRFSSPTVCSVMAFCHRRYVNRNGPSGSRNAPQTPTRRFLPAVSIRSGCPRRRYASLVTGQRLKRTQSPYHSTKFAPARIAASPRPPGQLLPGHFLFCRLRIINFFLRHTNPGRSRGRRTWSSQKLMPACSFRYRACGGALVCEAISKPARVRLYCLLEHSNIFFCPRGEDDGNAVHHRGLHALPAANGGGSCVRYAIPPPAPARCFMPQHILHSSRSPSPSAPRGSVNPSIEPRSTGLFVPGWSVESPTRSPPLFPPHRPLPGHR